MRYLPIDTTMAFDVGAYIGDTVPMIRGLGYKTIVCFEPHPNSFAQLSEAYKNDKDIIKVQAAVSSVSGKQVKMHVNLNLPWLHTLESNWIFNTRHEPHFQDRSECFVNTTTLDDFIESIGKVPDYIKIDVEGHELELFKGLNYKPNKISFEWITEFPEKNVLGLVKMKELGFKKFNVCFCEATPTKEDKDYTFEECIQRLVELRKSDTKNEIWGNIWCRQEGV